MYGFLSSISELILINQISLHINILPLLQDANSAGPCRLRHSTYDTLMLTDATHTSEKMNPGERLPGAIWIYVISLRKFSSSKPDCFRNIPESWETGLRPMEQPNGKVLGTFDLPSASHLRHTE